jgi:hypothetical protein
MSNDSNIQYNKFEPAKLGEVRVIKNCIVCKKECFVVATQDGQLLPPEGAISVSICGDCCKEYINQGYSVLVKQSDMDSLLVHTELLTILGITGGPIYTVSDEVFVNFESILQNKEVKNGE